MAMTEFGGRGPRRVLLRQALGGDEFVRVTWHQHNDVFVFSHWQGDTCTAATPIRVDDLGELATLTVTALAQRVGRPAGAWPAPLPDTIVGTALPA